MIKAGEYPAFFEVRMKENRFRWLCELCTAITFLCFKKIFFDGIGVHDIFNILNGTTKEISNSAILTQQIAFISMILVSFLTWLSNVESDSEFKKISKNDRATSSFIKIFYIIAWVRYYLEIVISIVVLALFVSFVIVSNSSIQEWEYCCLFLLIKLVRDGSFLGMSFSGILLILTYIIKEKEDSFESTWQ